MDNSFGAGMFGGGDTTMTTTETGRGDDSQGVAPLVIKQIHDSPGDGVQLFGFDYNMIAIVGIVRSIDHSSIKITYTVEDHTGCIDVYYWLEEDSTKQTPNVMVNCYATVHGSVRKQGGIKAIMVLKIEQIQSLNQITTHLLEVINARVNAEEFAKRGGSSNGNNKSVEDTKEGRSENSAANPFGFKGKQLVVYEAIKGNNTPAGISLKDLEQKFSHITRQELVSITDFMVQEGHIFTTIDTEHYMSTN